MLFTTQMERCPACRARLGEAEICGRCGTDFSISRRAERQAHLLARLAVHQLGQGQNRQAAATANAASGLADSPLARGVTQMLTSDMGNLLQILRRAGSQDSAQDSAGANPVLQNTTASPGGVGGEFSDSVCT